MDTVGDDAWKSVRLTWEVERWLPIGIPVAVLAFGLWVGLTGAAVGFLAELVVGPATIEPWTRATDVVAGVLFLCWVVAPAAVGTWLVRDRLTTVRGTLEIGYRLRHPTLLLLPPLVVLTTGALALIGLGTLSTSVLALLLAGSLWFQLRTIAFSYRVFAFSMPVLPYAMTMLTAGLFAVGTLVAGVRLAGRGVLVEAVATAFAVRIGSPAPATIVVGTVDLAGISVPALAATLVGVPVALSGAYIVVQVAAGLVARLIKPTTRRPELRSGQRYPEFARPTTTVAPSGPERSSAGTSTDDDGPRGVDGPATDDSATEPASDAGSDDSAPDEPDVDPDVSNTRVFTAGEDAPSVSPTTVDPDDDCPACGTTVDPESVSGTCPHCGADL